MDLGLGDKVVLLTGASGGLGSAIAEAFAANGAGGLALHYRSGREAAGRLAAAAAQEGVEAECFPGDLASPGEPGRLVAAVLERFGRIDVLVNNAGALVRRTSVAEADDELFEAMLAVNYRPVFATCRAAVPPMRRQGGGAIVNVSSIAARSGGGGGSVLYAAAKAAVTTFSRGLATELAGEGIRVNVVAPGLFDTEFHRNVTSREQFQRIGATIPIGRPGLPEECAGPVLFLASDAMSGYVTGHSLEVNGGRLMP